MTPEEFIARLAQLKAQGKDEGALEFAEHARSSVTPPLNPQEIGRIDGMMESAITRLRLRQWGESRERSSA